MRSEPVIAADEQNVETLRAKVVSAFEAERDNLIDLARFIHRHPEIAASQACGDCLAARGFAVEREIGNGWTEGTAGLKPGDKTVLEPNMTVHMMLGFWGGDWGYVCSEVFRVTDDGPRETFSSLTRRLFVNALPVAG